MALVAPALQPGPTTTRPATGAVAWERLWPHLDVLGSVNPVAVLARYHWDRVSAILDGAPVTPLVWELNPSGHCNVGCHFCLYADADEVTMPLDAFRTLVDQAAALGARAIIVAGDGEPLVHRHIGRMLRHVADRGLDLFLFTNATLVDRTVGAEDIVETCTQVLCGLYGATRESYHEVTRRDRFGDLTSGLRRLAAVASGRPTEARPMLVGGWVATGEQWREAAAVATLGRDLGLDWVYLRTDVTGESFTDPAAIDGFLDLLWELKRGPFAADPDFVQGRVLFDRALPFAIDDRGGAIGLFAPGSTAWPEHARWYTYHDLLYVGPALDVRISNRKHSVTRARGPFIVGDAGAAPLADLVRGDGPPVLYNGDTALVGQVVGRKALTNLFYNLLAPLGPAERDTVRADILERYPASPRSDRTRNYF